MADMRMAVACYVIVEPSLRDAAQIAAAAVAIDHGAVFLGIGLLIWAVADIAIKALAGVLLLRGQRENV